MNFQGTTGLIILIVVLVAAVLLVALAFAKNYIKVPPNVVAVFTGRGKMKIVRGGARFKLPLIERVDMMSLEPFNIQVDAQNSRSVDGVGISVSVVALVRFGSTDEAIETATQRFLTADRTQLQAQLREVIAGGMRAVCATMTVEDLNSNREALTRNVKNEAGAALADIGMQLDILTIQNISDEHGYLDALGRKRVAEVKRDAEIGEANAQRDSQIQSAQAIQAGKTAQAQADAEIAEAQRQLALKQASIAQEVEAAKARAAQAGPLAEAEARRAVVLAEVATDQQRTEAQIGVEQQRARQREQAVQADVIIPAEAERKAAVARAEGQRDAAIAAATAEAKQRELSGAADAEARKVLADASRAEMEANAAGSKAQKLAEADGIRAVRTAEAEGQEKMAEALTKFNSEAARLSVLPQLIEMLPNLARQVAEGVNIDKMVVIDSGGAGQGQGAIARALGVAPEVVGKLTEVMSSMGLDVNSLLKGFGDSKPAASPAVPITVDPTWADDPTDGAVAPA